MSSLFLWLRLSPLRKVILTLGLLLISFSTQARTTALAHYYQDTWTTLEGLPNNTINAISQTAEGYLWFATWEGVARYNGHEFRVFTRGEETGLPGSAMRSLTVDETGLWVTGVKGGLSYYQDNKWSPKPKASTMLNQVLVDNHGLLWLATEGDGIYVREGDKVIAHFDESQGLPSNYVYQLAQDAAGRIWAGTKRGLVWINDNNVYSVPKLKDVQVPALLLNQQGQLLIGTSIGLFLTEQTNVSQIYPELAAQSIVSLLEDDQGALWLGTADQGLLRVSELGIESLTVADGLLDQRIISLFQDKERSIWIGTHAGLMRLRDVPFVSFTEQDGLASNYVRTVLAHSDGSVWIGHGAGLSRIKEDKVNSLAVTMADGTFPSVLSLAEGLGGELWVGTFNHGLLRVEKGQITHVYDTRNGLAVNEVRSLLLEPNGNLWLGTSEGLQRLSNGRIEAHTATQALPSNYIMNLEQTANGDIWLGTRNGAAIIRGEQVTPVDLSRQYEAEYAFGFYSEPNGEYTWLGTDTGLVRYRYADQSFSLLGQKQGLPVDKIFAVIKASNGDLWLTSNFGITRISLADAHRVADGLQDTIEFEHFNERDGMGSSQTHGSSGPTAAVDAEGHIWIATARGVTRMEPERLSKFSHANLPVILEELKVSGVSLPLQSELRLPAGSSRVQFHFAGLGFVMPERIQYRTLLEGYDEDWVWRGGQNNAEYTNLPPGDYKFRVAAAYSYKDWDEQEVSLDFTVLPFIWQRPLFWLVMASFALILFWLLMRLRMQLLTFRTHELERQVSDKTQELQRQAHAFERQARIDSLTGLANRRAFDEALTVAFTLSQRTIQPLTLVVLDIDHFKRVNDTWSHGVGDEVIKIVANLIRQEIREADFAARWGGEEFTLLFSNTDASSVLPICERLRRAVMNYDFSHISVELKLTVSLGLAQVNLGMDEHKLLANADLALYQAKRGGRNKSIIFTEPEK